MEKPQWVQEEEAAAFSFICHKSSEQLVDLEKFLVYLERIKTVEISE
jgi:hypothetical protein